MTEMAQNRVDRGLAAILDEDGLPQLVPPVEIVPAPVERAADIERFVRALFVALSVCRAGTRA